MENNSNETQTNEVQPGSLPVTVSLNEFHDGIAEVFFLYVRSIGQMTDAKTAWATTGLPMEDRATFSMFNPDLRAKDVGLSFERIRQTQFAQAAQIIYDYAFYGRLDASQEEMGSGTYYSWVSAFLGDAAQGCIANEWDSYGSNISNIAEDCLLVAEIANARHVLEGGEAFYFFAKKDKDLKDRDFSVSGLTIRQMAILSGMEEMSVRSAANPKRANTLKTYSEDGRTCVALDVAKAWLQSKGRYIPITRFGPSVEIDFSKRRFADTTEMLVVIRQRYESLVARDGKEPMYARFAEIGHSINEDGSLPDSLFGVKSLSSKDQMRALAKALEWPADLFALRCQEAVLLNQVSRIERELREISQAVPNVQRVGEVK